MWMRKLEVLEILQRIGLVIQVTAVFRGGIAGPGERRNAPDVTSLSCEPSPKGNQANHLAAKDADLQEISGFELLQQQIPHGVEGVFTESTPVTRSIIKIRSMFSEFRGQLFK